MAGNAIIRLRRDTAANWTSANPVLALGEAGLETDTRKFKVGDGSTAWASLTYWDCTGSGGGLSDGDKGDITVSGSGTVWNIDAGAVGLAEMANVATSTVFYRKTAGTGAPEVQTLNTLKTDLGLTGTNSGDQTSIVGITGTLAEFNAALTGADFATGGGTATGTNTGDQTSIVGITGTLAEFNAALTGADFASGGGTATGTNTGDQTITLTGDVTGSGTGSFAATIANDAVTYAKMQNVSAASKLLGRGDSGSGDTQEITLGTGLAMTGTTLSASGSSSFDWGRGMVEARASFML